MVANLRAKKFEIGDFGESRNPIELSLQMLILFHRDCKLSTE